MIKDDCKRILQNAKSRWLTVNEILTLLSYIEPVADTSVVLRSLPLRPPIGSIFLVDYSKKKSKWKDDGYSYERRSNDTGFKEHSEKLGDDKKMVCLYSSISKEDAAYEDIKLSSEVEVKLQRRIYRHTDLHADLAVVHYFYSKRLHVSHDEEKQKNINIKHTTSSSNNHSTDANFLSMSTGMDIEDQSELSKVEEIERQIQALQDQLKLHLTSSATRSPAEKVPVNIDIVDFTPEWDYLEGGSKMIICTRANRQVPINTTVDVNFGSLRVEGVFIQDNVIRCYVPSSVHSGKTSLHISSSHKECIIYSSVQSFEYRDKSEMRGKRLISISDSDADEIADKVFKSRLMNQMMGYGSPDLDLNMFGDNNSEDWFRDNFTDGFILERLQHLSQKLGEDRLVEMVTSKDKYGLESIHYLKYFGFVDTLKYLKSVGVDLSILPELSVSEGEDEMGENLNFKLIREHKDYVESYLRQISLNESISISNRSDHPSVEGPNENIEEDLYLQNLFTILSSSNSSNIIMKELSENSSKQQDSNLHKICESLERRDFINRRKRMRNIERNIKNRVDEKMPNVRTGDSSGIINPQLFGESQEQVKLIQKNVRGWLRRRQYLDTKYAVKILQSHFKEIHTKIK